jgi:hypothetical protein
MLPVVDTAALVTWAVLVFAAMLRFVCDPIRRFKSVSVVVLLLSFSARYRPRQMAGVGCDLGLWVRSDDHAHCSMGNVRNRPYSTWGVPNRSAR